MSRWPPAFEDRALNSIRANGLTDSGELMLTTESGGSVGPSPALTAPPANCLSPPQRSPITGKRTHHPCSSQMANEFSKHLWELAAHPRLIVDKGGRNI